MLKKYRLALIGAATAIVVAVGGVGIASADDNGRGGNPFSQLLSKLVGNGTITQDQADAITKAADDDMAAHHAEHQAREEAHQAVIAKALGMEWSAIQTRLQAGETLADIAGSKKAALIKALVTFEEKEIAQGVTDGRLTEAQATEMKSHVTERVTAMVEGTFGGHGMGPRGMGGPGMGGPGMGGPDMDGFGGHGDHDGFGDGPMGTSGKSG